MSNNGTGSAFLIPKKIVDLTFPKGHAWHGAIISVRLNVPLSAYLGITRAAATEAQLVERYKVFVTEAVSKWNISDEAGEIPISLDGVERLPLSMANELINRWADALLGEDDADPLSETAESKQQFDELDIPATPISPE